MKHKNLSVEKIVSVYRSKAANMTNTAAALNVSRTALYNWRKSDDKLDEAMSSCEEELIDNAETALYKQVIEGNITAIIFLLKTKGKNRGYVESVENKVSVNSFEQLLMEDEDG